MNFVPHTLNRETEAFQQPTTVLEALRAILPALRDNAAEGDATGTIAPASWAALQDIGLIAAPLPGEHGGSDLTAPRHTGTLVDVLRLLGSADLSLARLFEGHLNAVSLVVRYGSDAQVAGLATSLHQGGLSAVWGADDATGLHAEYDDAAVRLHGRKVMASGVGFVSRPLVTARTPDGPVMVLLDLAPGERADVSGWTAQGMRASATGVVTLDGMVVQADRIVGRPGDFLRQPHFSGGAWRFCAVHLGAAERLVDLFRMALVSRGRHEDPYQLQRVAHCAVAVGTAAFWIRDAARRLADDRESAEEVVAATNLTRMVTERAALDVIEAVHRGAGLPSFLRPNPVERIARDLATYLRQPVPDLAMADAARAVLASPREIGDMRRAP